MASTATSKSYKDLAKLAYDSNCTCGLSLGLSKSFKQHICSLKHSKYVYNDPIDIIFDEPYQQKILKNVRQIAAKATRSM